MVQLLDERGTYFMDMRGYPYVHLNYPPVFPVLVWPFYRWLGPTLWVPRLLSILATAGILIAVFALARRFGHPRAMAAALAGLALCPWFVQTWAPLARVDMLAIFLSLAGLGVWPEPSGPDAWIPTRRRPGGPFRLRRPRPTRGSSNTGTCPRGRE
jgi:4-amino-4-deoxy-L-arabinose transferase-like glycosyltransferase